MHLERRFLRLRQSALPVICAMLCGVAWAPFGCDRNNAKSASDTPEQPLPATLPAEEHPTAEQVLAAPQQPLEINGADCSITIPATWKLARNEHSPSDDKFVNQSTLTGSVPSGDLEIFITTGGHAFLTPELEALEKNASAASSQPAHLPMVGPTTHPETFMADVRKVGPVHLIEQRQMSVITSNITAPPATTPTLTSGGIPEQHVQYVPMVSWTIELFTPTTGSAQAEKFNRTTLSIIIPQTAYEQDKTVLEAIFKTIAYHPSTLGL